MKQIATELRCDLHASESFNARVAGNHGIQNDKKARHVDYRWTKPYLQKLTREQVFLEVLRECTSRMTFAERSWVELFYDDDGLSVTVFGVLGEYDGAALRRARYL